MSVKWSSSDERLFLWGLPQGPDETACLGTQQVAGHCALSVPHALPSLPALTPQRRQHMPLGPCPESLCRWHPPLPLRWESCGCRFTNNLLERITLGDEAALPLMPGKRRALPLPDFSGLGQPGE